MYASFSGFTASPASPHSESLRALRATPAVAGGSPHLYAYGPVARVNPYQALLYGSFSDHGFAVSPLLEPNRVRDLLDLKPLTSGLTIHLHWLSWVTARASEESKALSLGKGYLGRLAHFKARGGTIVWTVHNLYPHDSQHLDVDLEIQQGVADVADVIHLMSPASLSSLRDITTLDEGKVVYAPHPTYEGAYEDYISRAEARAALGLDADEIVFVMFGALKAYKGLPRLYSGFRRLVHQHAGESRFRLILAGQADDVPEVQEVVRSALADPFVLVEPRRVPAARVQYLLRAADVGLVPYDRSLNSGALLLYQTFGLPVAATDTPVFREALDDQTGVLLPPDADDDAVASALLRAANLATPDVAAQVKESVSDLHPRIVSKRFARELAPRLES